MEFASTTQLPLIFCFLTDIMLFYKKEEEERANDSKLSLKLQTFFLVMKKSTALLHKKERLTTKSDCIKKEKQTRGEDKE